MQNEHKDITLQNIRESCQKSRSERGYLIEKYNVEGINTGKEIQNILANMYQLDHYDEENDNDNIINHE